MTSPNRPHCQNSAACAARRPTTHCRSCAATALNKTDEHRAKTAASMREKYDEPGFRELQSKRLKRALAKSAEDPAWLEAKRQNGVRHGAPNIVHTRSPEVRAKAGKRIREVKLAHVPEHLRDEYVKLSRTKGMTRRERIEVVNSTLERERQLSPEAEARRIIDRITREMHEKRAREKAQAY